LAKFPPAGQVLSGSLRKVADLPGIDPPMRSPGTTPVSELSGGADILCPAFVDFARFRGAEIRAVQQIGHHGDGNVLGEAGAVGIFQQGDQPGVEPVMGGLGHARAFFSQPAGFGLAAYFDRLGSSAGFT
jgi:hypothetical protein